MHADKIDDTWWLILIVSRTNSKNRSYHMRPGIWPRQHSQSGQGFCVNTMRRKKAKNGSSCGLDFRYACLMVYTRDSENSLKLINFSKIRQWHVIPATKLFCELLGMLWNSSREQQFANANTEKGIEKNTIFASCRAWKEPWLPEIFKFHSKSSTM